MINLDETDFLSNECAVINLRGEIENIVDEICSTGYSNLIMLGVGGSYAHAMQMQYLVDMISDNPFYAVQAGDLIMTGFAKINQESIVIIESASGEDLSLMEALDKCKLMGCRVIGIINDSESTLAKKVDYLISFPVGSYYKLYYLVFRFLYQSDQFPAYSRFCKALEDMPEVKLSVKKQYDTEAAKMAENIADAKNIYLIGCGVLWSSVYAYGMYTLEERLWMKTKSVNGNEFFYGTLEIIDKDSVVVLFKGNDASRCVMDRAEKLLNRICKNVYVMDTDKFALSDSVKEFSDLLSPFLLSTMCERLNTYLEIERRHPLDVRRYKGNIDY